MRIERPQSLSELARSFQGIDRPTLRLWQDLLGAGSPFIDEKHELVTQWPEHIAHNFDYLAQICSQDLYKEPNAWLHQEGPQYGISPKTFARDKDDWMINSLLYHQQLAEIIQVYELAAYLHNPKDFGLQERAVQRPCTNQHEQQCSIAVHPTVMGQRDGLRDHYIAYDDDKTGKRFVFLQDYENFSTYFRVGLASFRSLERYRDLSPKLYEAFMSINTIFLDSVNPSWDTALSTDDGMPEATIIKGVANQYYQDVHPHDVIAVDRPILEHELTHIVESNLHGQRILANISELAAMSNQYAAYLRYSPYEKILSRFSQRTLGYAQTLLSFEPDQAAQTDAYTYVCDATAFIVAQLKADKPYFIEHNALRTHADHPTVRWLHHFWDQAPEPDTLGYKLKKQWSPMTRLFS